jgi:putative addiction module killer protein
MTARRDSVAAARIPSRIRRMAFGNFGDVAPVGEDVSELRIHYGPGYRGISSSMAMKSVCFCVGVTRNPGQQTLNQQSARQQQ